MPPRLAALKTGTLPAVILSPLDVEALKQDGVAFRGHMLEDGMKDNVQMAFNGVATSDALIKKNPDLVLRFVRATLKGTRFMIAFKDKTIANVMKYGNSDRRSTEIDYDDVVRTLTKDGSISPARAAGRSRSSGRAPQAAEGQDSAARSHVRFQLRQEGQREPRCRALDAETCERRRSP